MPSFDYTATHDDGRELRGSAIGESLEEVIQDLALRGMLVTKIAPASSFNDPIPSDFSAAPRPAPVASADPIAQSKIAPPVPIPPAPLPLLDRQSDVAPADKRSYLQTSVWGPLVGQVPLVDIQFFFRQFAAMQNAGVPMVSSLGTLAKQTRNPKLANLILEIQAATQEGKPVTYAMQRYPEVFSGLMISLLRAGEEGGFFQSSLTQLADYIEAEVELRNLYRKSTLYPKAVVISSIVIISCANFIIGAVGGKSFIDSPLTNFTILGTVVALIVGFVVFLRVGLANPRIKYNWDAFTLKIPYLGVTLHQFAMAKFGRALGALQKGGVPVAKSVLLAADACGNEYLRSKIYPAGPKLDRGDGLAGTLADTGALGPILLDMLHTGELSGNVDSMLTRAADFYEEESKVRANQLAVVTGVVALVLVAIYVGYVVIRFYTGIFAPITQQAQQGTEVIMPLGRGEKCPL